MASSLNRACAEACHGPNRAFQAMDAARCRCFKVRDETGRQFNVEMQMLAYGAFRSRALYYWSRLHQGQLREGDDYSALRPTIAVCFVDTPLFQELSGYHHIFDLRERHHQTLFTNQTELHILAARGRRPCFKTPHVPLLSHPGISFTHAGIFIKIST